MSDYKRLQGSVSEDQLTDHDVRALLRAHQDGGPISHLFETGEINDDTFPALSQAAERLTEQGDHEGAETLCDAISYAAAAGDRPPVAGWPTR
ncbi:hypothetical protein [Streptomyces uncialis]|uniref:Uncharacterized protein n=1 Tax=Streptomyces uncialis TaxID=1048205 RepID=A0A1Q4UY59_9ACTN|nr:hypothetical protein [Streptomyces uncialis]OKH90486.1 hypothetical protein AB852_35590 [Streptomyces uncialis]